MIDILLYLTTSRPNKMLTIRLVSRYQSTPKQGNLLETKKPSNI